MSRKKRLVTIIALATLLVGILGGAAIAATQTQTTAGKANLYQDFVSKLAANLGIDQSQVTTALDTTKKQMLDEAVQSGKLTRQQADKIAASPGGCLGLMGRFNGQKGFGWRGRMSGNIAQVLGITQDQLKSELKSGKKLSQIVADQGMTMDQFGQKMLDAGKAALDKAVADGKLTQDQADKMLSKMTNMEKRFTNPAPQTGDNDTATPPQSGGDNSSTPQ